MQLYNRNPKRSSRAGPTLPVKPDLVLQLRDKPPIPLWLPEESPRFRRSLFKLSDLLVVLTLLTAIMACVCSAFAIGQTSVLVMLGQDRQQNAGVSPTQASQPTVNRTPLPTLTPTILTISLTATSAPPTPVISQGMVTPVQPTPTITPVQPTPTFVPIIRNVPAATGAAVNTFPTPTPTSTPIPVPPQRPQLAGVAAVPAAPPQPTATATVTLTPVPNYAYQAVEIFKDITTNPFLTGYVAIVSPDEIPIGGVKAVGHFEPGDLSHQSPLSKWFFDAASAPGQTKKIASVKFEPPGGILAGTWQIHLEDEWGTRLSEAVPITTDPNRAEWFYVKFKQNSPRTIPTSVTVVPKQPTIVAINRPTPGVTRQPLPTYSPTPTPVKESPTTGWVFANVRTFTNEDDDWVVLYGNMVNNTGSAQEITYINGVFFDSSGQVIADYDDPLDYWPVEVVAPGDWLPFELTVYDVTSVARFDLEVFSRPNGQTPRYNFELSDLKPSNDDGEYCVSGKLRNPGGQLNEYLVVGLVLYNGQNNVVSFGTDEASSPEEVTGANALEFEACVDTLDQNVGRYEVRAWGR